MLFIKYFVVFLGIPGDTTPTSPTAEGFSPTGSTGNLPAVIYPWMRRMQAPGKLTLKYNGYHSLSSKTWTGAAVEALHYQPGSGGV